VSLCDAYKALSDPVRLRLLHLLAEGPLCVCHLHRLLDQPQPRVSKQLAQLRELGLLESTRHFNWTIYRLAEPLPPLLAANLELLRERRREEPQLERDLSQLRAWLRDAASGDTSCPPGMLDSHQLPTRSRNLPQEST